MHRANQRLSSYGHKYGCISLRSSAQLQERQVDLGKLPPESYVREGNALRGRPCPLRARRFGRLFHATGKLHIAGTGPFGADSPSERMFRVRINGLLRPFAVGRARSRCFESDRSTSAYSAEFPAFRAGVQRARANEPVVVVLLDDVGTPAGHTRTGEDRGIQRRRNPELPQHDGSIEVHVGAEILLFRARRSFTHASTCSGEPISSRTRIDSSFAPPCSGPLRVPMAVVTAE